MPIDSSDETVGSLLSNRDAANARLDPSDVSLIIILVASIDDHKIVIHLIKHRLRATRKLSIVATSSTSKDALNPSRNPISLQCSNKTVIHCLILLASHANDVEATVTLLEDLAMQLFVLISQ